MSIWRIIQKLFVHELLLIEFVLILSVCKETSGLQQWTVETGSGGWSERWWCVETPVGGEFHSKTMPDGSCVADGQVIVE